MNREEVLYLAPYLLSLLLSVGVLIYSWQHRNVRGAGAYTWFVAGQTLSILAFIFELVSPGLEAKIVWDKVQWVTETLIIVIAYLIFAIQFTETRFRHPRVFWALILAIPVVFNLFLITDWVHHLIYPNPHLSTALPFPDLEYDFTPIVYVLSIYIYAGSIYGIGLLVARIFRPHNLYRSQLAAISIGFLIPVVLSVFALFDIRISPHRDVFPFSAALGNLVVAWGLFRFRLFEIVPIARERVFENMTDPVIVVDALGRIVDINAAALKSIDQRSSQVVGQPSDLVFKEWRDLVDRFQRTREENTEITVNIRGAKVIYELNISPIYDNRKRLLGRVFVAHEITRRKTLEEGYRQLSEELELRVQERTGELAEAYDTTLEGWVKALELRDKETEGHSRRVTETALKVARKMGLSDEQLTHIRRGAILHDIGKIGIPDEILRKPGPLTADERNLVMGHPKIAYDLLAHIPHLKSSLEIPYSHHEKWNGMGYPRGLREDQIPISARIFAIVDVWDALSSDRPYRQAWPKDQVIAHIKDESGQYFDPDIVGLFVAMLENGEI